ncbi:MAG: hypothetical protein WA738_18425 [Candidatus Angelobacter sp.]
MKSGQQSGTAKAFAVLGTLALLIFLLGVWRFIRLGHFTPVDAVYCVLAVPAAMLLILILDYTLHHALVACALVLVVLVTLAFRSPAFCTGLGAGLAGVLWTQREK